MKTSPSPCTCESCECAIYTYEDEGVCKACKEGQHLSGAKRKTYTESEQEKNSQLST